VEGHGVEEWRGADMADKHDKCSLAREVEPSQKAEKGLDTSALKPLVKLAFHER
jgi:hypothetical protein